MYKLFFKRFLDIICSIITLVILIPFLLIIAIIIKVDSKGSVFFLQNRIGYKGRIFKIIKFRTMIENAEQLGTGIKVFDSTDNRITKVGKVLRKTSLDELPQLINVIKGDMSLVGPRPPVVYHPYDGYKNYPDFAKRRFEMKPGITGLAQIKYRNSASWEQRFESDIAYVHNCSLMIDIEIIVKTILRVIKPQSMYLDN